MKVSALTNGERAYLLGLYFADGWIRERHNCHSMTLYLILQVNELEIANKCADLLKRTGLRPIIHFSKHENSIILSATAGNLVSLFGRKSLNSLDGNAGFTWMTHVGKLEVPFIAGLIDGDGSVRANYVGLKDSIFGVLGEEWTFSQTRYPFLIDFIYQYINSVASGGATIVVSPKGKKRRIVITAIGRRILLRRGIGRFSFKIKWFLAQAERIRTMMEVLRSRFLTTGEVARKVGVFEATVGKWCRRGYVKHMIICSASSKGCGGYRYIIPAEEVEKLKIEVAREKELEYNANRSGTKLVKVAKMLGFSACALEKWVKVGKLRATLVVKGKGTSDRGGIKYYVIPNEEVERLKQEIGAREKPRPIESTRKFFAEQRF